MSWATRVLPVFMAAASGIQPARLHESLFDVQIDTTLHRFKFLSSSGFPVHGARFNRALLSYWINELGSGFRRNDGNSMSCRENKFAMGKPRDADLQMKFHVLCFFVEKFSGPIMAGSWGCPHEANDLCSKVNNLPCDPGMKGCVLHGRFVFANDDKNERLRQKKAREEAAGSSPPELPESSA